MKSFEVTNETIEQLEQEREHLQAEVKNSREAVNKQQAEVAQMHAELEKLEQKIMSEMRAGKNVKTLRKQFNSLTDELSHAQRWVDNLRNESTDKPLTEQLNKVEQQLAREYWSEITKTVKKECEDKIAECIEQMFKVVDDFNDNRVKFQREHGINFLDITSRKQLELNFFHGFAETVERTSLKNIENELERWPNKIRLAVRCQSEQETINV